MFSDFLKRKMEVLLYARKLKKVPFTQRVYREEINKHISETLLL